ncbi:replication endonuclease [Aeromonas sp. FDAARGOS 1415]|uniref:replication endonuclease n=1 Tax=Aeromonas TaxID=642 RepID=UPI001C23C5AF|nr:replication endonuclease [Aeromonas sp. FDAARGOS 1415]QXB54187.1 replication endonuclease [Aeromonas sp. FDAARGOS 1415]
MSIQPFNGRHGMGMTFTSYAAQRTLDGSRKAPTRPTLLATPVLTADELTPEEYLGKLQSERGLQDEDVQLLHRIYADGYQKTTVALASPAPARPFTPVPFSAEAVADKFAALPIGTAEDAKLRERVVLRHPSCVGWFTHVYQSRNALLGVQAANEAVRRLDESLSVRSELGELRYSLDDDGVDTFAQRFADHTGRLVSTRSHVVALRLVMELAYQYGLSPVDTITDEQQEDPYPTLNRWADMAWVRRRVRRVSARRLYDAAREHALISARLAAYTTDLSVARRSYRLARNDETLSALVAHNVQDVFDAVGMKEAVDASTSNRTNRRAELMTRLRGFEECAKEQRHVAIFLTFTCPSRFHSVHRNGTSNQNWIDAGRPTVRAAQGWLINAWNNIRKRANEAEIKPYGFRFAEPHHDGTPHWHAVLFMSTRDAKDYLKICRDQMLADSGNEPGAKQHRFKVVFIDPRKGSAVGYCSKYVAKNIDGYAVGKDHEAGKRAKAVDTAIRVDAWKSDNRIRQFQQIGGPSVTAWREFRRLRTELDQENPMFQDLTPEQHFALENVRKAADAGDWAAFCCAMGGVQVRRADQTVKVQYGIPEAMMMLCDEDGVMLRTPRTKTQYGDKAALRAMGLMYCDVFLLTRAKDWLITSKERWEAACKKTMEGIAEQFDTLHEERVYQFMEYEAYEAMRQVAICDHQSRVWLLYPDTDRLAGSPPGCEPDGVGLDPCH